MTASDAPPPPSPAPDQLTFDLPKRIAVGRADFLVSASNAMAVRQIEEWRNWPSGRLALIGPSGSGKSHLVAVWRDLCCARVVPAVDLVDPQALLGEAAPLAVEGVDLIDTLATPRRRQVEEALFHLYNSLNQAGAPFLLTGCSAPSRWRIGLPDLASRLATLPVAEIALPDDAVLSSILVKLFRDRHVAIKPDAVQYLVNRMERSFEAIGPLVDRIDRAALKQKRAVGVPLIKEVTGWTR